MTDLNKVTFCLENIKGKNLGQNPDNLTRFLIKDLSYEKEHAEKLIEKAICANVIKSVIFNGKVSYRTVTTDSVTDNTVLVPDTQEIVINDNHEENSNRTVKQLSLKILKFLWSNNNATVITISQLSWRNFVPHLT